MKIKIIIILLLLITSNLYSDTEVIEEEMSDVQFYKILFIILGTLILGCIKFDYGVGFFGICTIFTLLGIFSWEDWGVAFMILIFIPILCAQGARDFIKGGK